MGTARPSRLPLLLVLAYAAFGCTNPVETRAEVMRLDTAWRVSTMEEDSFQVMLEGVRELGDQPPRAEGRQLAIPELLRVALENPSALIRAEALRSAWRLADDLPARPWRVDAVDREIFNQKTQRLEQLVHQPDAAQDPEAIALAHWLGAFRVPPESKEHRALAVSVSEVVLSQALWRDDALGRAFREELPGCVHHALSVVTEYSAGDAYPVVREEALLAARHLDPEVALRMVTDMLERESDAAVVLAALDSLEQLAPSLPRERLVPVLEPLAGSSDVAVRRRIRELLGGAHPAAAEPAG